MQTLMAYLRLMRPANIITAIADILAGYSVAFYYHKTEILEQIPDFEAAGWLVLATIGLYGGGVVLNDFFDADLDRVERPERPIPSGKASKQGAGIFGFGLVALGVLAALQVSWPSGLLAAATGGCAILYDSWGKHQTFFGPVNMGLCRGGNLLLGMSAFASAPAQFWFTGLLPVVFISAVTMISRGEVHGKNTFSLKFGFVLYFVVITGILLLAFIPDYQYLFTVPFLILFAWLVFPPLVKAIKKPEPRLIGLSVKAGVLSLIVMDAAIAAGFAGWKYGLVVLALLPLSRVVARFFAVT